MTTTSDYYDDNGPSGIDFLGVLFFLFIGAVVLLGVIICSVNFLMADGVFKRSTKTSTMDPGTKKPLS